MQGPELLYGIALLSAALLVVIAVRSIRARRRTRREMRAATDRSDCDRRSSVPHFLAHLEERDAASAQFARRLLDAGAIVRVFWGPLQMDVWELRVQRGDMIVMFRVERGFSDGVCIAPVTATHFDGGGPWAGFVPMEPAVIAWAASNDVPLSVDDLEQLHSNLTVYGLAVVDWVGDGHIADVERAMAAWSARRMPADQRDRGAD